MSTYGRSRQSIADLEQELHDIFRDHPESHISDEDEPVIPGHALVDVLRTFSKNHEAVPLMTDEEENQLTELLASNPGIAVTPQVLLQFIAMRTSASPHYTPEGSPSRETERYEERGRSEDSNDGYEIQSRSSSRDSERSAVFRPPSRPPSRPASRMGPVTPKTPTSRESPFDATRRQRSTPLAGNAPSSWTRRPPPSRRKSDAGQHSRELSDSESSSPGSHRTPGRVRAPSNPTSPSISQSSMYSPVSSPQFGATYSRPHSRAQSQPQSSFMALDSAVTDYHYGSSPERDHTYRQPAHNGTGLMSPPPSDLSESSFDEECRFMDGVNTLPMPRSPGSDDSDEELEDSTLGLVMDRSAASSTVSMEVHERLDALQRANTHLAEKLMQAERTLQDKIADHEQELEEMQSRIEELRAELSATKREEKELRSKERQNYTQITALESEISKLQKSLDTARTSYQSLQKQYQEQCTESERYRSMMRRRDEEIKDYQEAAALHNIEQQKWGREQANFEERIAFLEGELAIATQAQVALDEQKQENLMLKETIDRMRFELDEMRTKSIDQNLGRSGSTSAQATISKSLGAELLNKMGEVSWEAEPDEDFEEGSSTEVEVEGDGNSTEDEDVIQTIITRTKRKVASRAKRIETLKVEEVKEYSDTATQHDPSEFTRSCDAQTDPEPKVATATFSTQTDDLPPSIAMSVQTEPEPDVGPNPRPTVDAEIQTDTPPAEPSSSSTSPLVDDEDEAMASSSSTLLPPTPKAQPQHLHPHSDLPPSYNQVAGQDADALALRVANETLKQWHKGLQLPIEPIAGGISEEAVEDWKVLKEELGVECTAIDKLIEESAKHNQPRTPKTPRTRRGRFYNIYNTYVYGDREGRSLVSTGQFLFCIGVSAAVAFLVGQAMAPSQAMPGGPTYYDRVAWSAFNSMQHAGEGFPGDGAALWNVLGRMSGGAVRNIRGWPT
ncbi:hypothetical protein CERSUDRAFT_159094 [Gelatoporia subvermispora B]|uniref:Uncharacterized protein n=1 Tax=Ceriporiopsis subvermispora (strain B) TaxID=914234 RepID=M2QA99_CERS8|nr:hypothetical protein CERSUDRAFT_159094 [Gelatoporia subvermispora B]